MVTYRKLCVPRVSTLKKNQNLSLTSLKINSDFISNRFNTLVFVIEVACAFCEVKTESFYDKQIKVRLYVFKLYFRIAERHFTLL